MSFLDDMRLHDLSLLQTLDGRVVIYTPDGGTPRVIADMLQGFSEMVSGESVDITSSRPVLSVRTADIPKIQTDDQFQIDGQIMQFRLSAPTMKASPK
jgi:hypothetical protein